MTTAITTFIHNGMEVEVEHHTQPYKKKYWNLLSDNGRTRAITDGLFRSTKAEAPTSKVAICQRCAKENIKCIFNAQTSTKAAATAHDHDKDEGNINSSSSDDDEDDTSINNQDYDGASSSATMNNSNQPQHTPDLLSHYAVNDQAIGNDIVQLVTSQIPEKTTRSWTRNIKRIGQTQIKPGETPQDAVQRIAEAHHVPGNQNPQLFKSIYRECLDVFYQQLCADAGMSETVERMMNAYNNVHPFKPYTFCLHTFPDMLKEIIHAKPGTCMDNDVEDAKMLLEVIQKLVQTRNLRQSMKLGTCVILANEFDLECRIDLGNKQFVVNTKENITNNNTSTTINKFKPWVQEIVVLVLRRVQVTRNDIKMHYVDLVTQKITLNFTNVEDKIEDILCDDDQEEQVSNIITDTDNTNSSSNSSSSNIMIDDQELLLPGSSTNNNNDDGSYNNVAKDQFVKYYQDVKLNGLAPQTMEKLEDAFKNNPLEPWFRDYQAPFPDVVYAMAKVNALPRDEEMPEATMETFAQYKSVNIIKKFKKVSDIYMQVLEAKNDLETQYESLQTQYEALQEKTKKKNRSTPSINNSTSTSTELPANKKVKIDDTLAPVTSTISTSSITQSTDNEPMDDDEAM
jgi:hypothetical protein